MEKCILVDGSGLIYRGFYAIPPFLKSPSGVQTNAVFGFTSILLTLIANQKPDYIAVAFDKKGPTFRHKAFEAYKATRIKAPQELYDQIPLVKNVVETFGIPHFEVAGFEADDILATIVEKLAPQKNIQVFIATGDFDMFQVISTHCFILYPAKGFKDAEIFKTADVEKKYGLHPNQIPDFKGLAGDHSDNIPGVHGIGEKGAKELLQKFKTLEGIYENLNQISEGQRKKLEAGREDAFMSKRLAELEYNVPLDFDLAECRVRDFNVKTVRGVLGNLGFKSLQKRLDDLYGAETSQGALF